MKRRIICPFESWLCILQVKRGHLFWQKQETKEGLWLRSCFSVSLSLSRSHPLGLPSWRPAEVQMSGDTLRLPHGATCLLITLHRQGVVWLLSVHFVSRRRRSPPFSVANRETEREPRRRRDTFSLKVNTRRPTTANIYTSLKFLFSQKNTERHAKETLWKSKMTFMTWRWPTKTNKWTHWIRKKHWWSNVILTSKH